MGSRPCTWGDSLFAACLDYERGTDCRALLPEENCGSCAKTTQEEVCMELARRFNPDREVTREVSRESTTLRRDRLRRPLEAS